MSVDPVRNTLDVDAFNTLPLSSNPIWECSIDQQALPQSAEGGTLASVYRQSEFSFNNCMPTSKSSPLDHWSEPYPSATFTATPSVFQTLLLQTSHQLGIPSPPLTAEEEEDQKRKRYSNKISARKSLRRGSSRGSKAHTATGGRGASHSNGPCDTQGRHDSGYSDQQRKRHSQYTKERSRITAAKSRTKK